jgi:hypothetical protein
MGGRYSIVFGVPGRTDLVIVRNANGGSAGPGTRFVALSFETESAAAGVVLVVEQFVGFVASGGSSEAFSFMRRLAEAGLVPEAEVAEIREAALALVGRLVMRGWLRSGTKVGVR